MLIRELSGNEIENAAELAWTVFKTFEAPDYGEQGITEFFKCIHDSQFLSQLKFYGAFDGDDIVGTIATRSSGNHISLFFVNEQYQRQGIGKALFSRICKDNFSGKITVHSSPFAIPVYHQLGFTDIDTEQVTNGLRYTPMECVIHNGKG
ncbi:MAG: GNAT family N-acetyltransferase [Bacillota bacterium]|nr:GNAT family N-acetyltransferase [Bacillota bacterium]